MDNPLDQTTLSTISLLEARLLRIEHLLHGPSASHEPGKHEPASRKMEELERRLASVVSQFRVYGELLKICMPRLVCANYVILTDTLPDNTNPDFFHSPAPEDPPSQLPPDAIQAIVLASAPSFPATQSALTAIKDCPIPDTSESATLVALAERMKAIEATQIAQAAQMAELRQRGEAVMRSWYEGRFLVRSRFMADTESRVEKVEQKLRRMERQREEDNQV